MRGVRAAPAVVTVRGGDVVDITSKTAPSVCDVWEMENPAGYVANARGRPIATLVDLQAVKASGVTFVASLLERVIEEQAGGDPEKARAIRADISDFVGHDLSQLKPGSAQAQAVKEKLIARGAWSQ